MNKKLKNDNGFTLIELMVVVGILGILMAAFGTSTFRSLPDYRLKSIVLDLRSALQNVRLEAVKRNTNVDFDFNSINLPSGVELVGAVNFPVPVTFNSRGFPINLATTGEIRLKSTTGAYKGVSMNIVGNSKVIRSVDDGATWN